MSLEQYLNKKLMFSRFDFNIFFLEPFKTVFNSYKNRYTWCFLNVYNWVIAATPRTLSQDLHPCAQAFQLVRCARSPSCSWASKKETLQTALSRWIPRREQVWHRALGLCAILALHLLFSHSFNTYSLLLFSISARSVNYCLFAVYSALCIALILIINTFFFAPYITVVPVYWHTGQPRYPKLPLASLRGLWSLGR